MGVRMTEVMAEEGINQKELAAKARVNASSLSRIEQGKALGGVHAASVLRIARALGVEPGWLLCGEGPKRRVQISVSDSLSAEAVRELVREELRQQGR